MLPDFDLITWEGRDAIILFDANARTNPLVRAARRALAEELTGRGAQVRFANLPQIEGVNGPDDCVAICGDRVLEAVLDNAVLYADAARAEAADAIAAIESKTTPIEPDEIKHLYRSLAVIDDVDARILLTSQAAAALRGTIAKADATNAVARSRQALLLDRREIQEQARIAALGKVGVNPAQLVRELETFLAQRIYLPVGAALLLAFFTLLTWTYEIFDSVPYVSVESAVPNCGKTTLRQAIHAVCARGRMAASLTEAVLFRLVHEFHPTLLLDEAETIQGKSERAEALRAVCHEGYKRGGQVARCEGDDHHLVWFDVFGPKVFFAIGGLTGPLSSRCIVLHMTRAPKDFSRKSTRLRILARDAAPLRQSLEAYSLQFQARLTQLYEEEPAEGYWPEITDREAELWGPLLIHARLAGPELEAELLNVVETFTKGKRAIQADDWRIAQIIDLRDAIQSRSEAVQFARFFPADLLEELATSEAWAYSFSKAKDDKAKAVKVGRLLSTFRLKSRVRERSGSSYEVQEALEVLTRHIPEGAAKKEAAEPTAAPSNEDAVLAFDFGENLRQEVN